MFTRLRPKFGFGGPQPWPIQFAKRYAQLWPAPDSRRQLRSVMPAQLEPMKLQSGRIRLRQPPPPKLHRWRHLDGRRRLLLISGRSPNSRELDLQRLKLKVTRQFRTTLARPWPDRHRRGRRLTRQANLKRNCERQSNIRAQAVTRKCFPICRRWTQPSSWYAKLR